MLNIVIGKKYRRRNGTISECIKICSIRYSYGSVAKFNNGFDVWVDNGRVIHDRTGSDDIIEEVNEMKIEVGKWYKTRGGAKVFVGMHVPSGKAKPYVGYQVIENDVYFCDMSWFEDGSFTTHTPMHAADLIEEWKEPKSGVRYINIYEDGLAHKTREVADHSASNGRIACIRVEWKEGQFDE